tara:strand:+ start:57 stop:473 length:417 start_codon:yes stop_codon:yes gene_type:complete
MDFHNKKDAYKNHNSKWIQADIDKVKDLIKNKTIIDVNIALEFGRTQNAVKSQILKILYEYYSKNENDNDINDGLCCINIYKETFISKYNQYIANKEINKSIKEQNIANKAKTIQKQIEELNQKLDLIIKKLDTLEIE